MATKLRIFLLVVLAVIIAAAGAVYSVLAPCHRGEEAVVLDIYPNTSLSDVRQQLRGGIGFDLACRIFKYEKPRTGHYVIPARTSWLDAVRMLHNHKQQPIRLILPSLRTLNHLAAFLGEKLMADSADFASAFHSAALLDSIGYTEETLPSLFIPNTYEVWWDISVPSFIGRMLREHDTFWNNERISFARQQGLTPVEVATLASIIDEETANNAEKPMVAGMYLNRLRTDMLLQADPTVKFALQDFSLRRILHAHLVVESPYNTYINKGLPPGPIRIASVASIDAVLHAAEHPYLYMCANSDFSGTHVFAVTYSDHLKNARLYQRALNQRNIH